MHSSLKCITKTRYPHKMDGFCPSCSVWGLSPFFNLWLWTSKTSKDDHSLFNTLASGHVEVYFQWNRYAGFLILKTNKNFQWAKINWTWSLKPKLRHALYREHTRNMWEWIWALTVKSQKSLTDTTTNYFQVMKIDGCKIKRHYDHSNYYAKSSSDS